MPPKFVKERPSEPLKKDKLVEEVQRYQLQKDVILQHFDTKEKIKEQAHSGEQKYKHAVSPKKERGWMIGLHKGAVS